LERPEVTIVANANKKTGRIAAFLAYVRRLINVQGTDEMGRVAAQRIAEVIRANNKEGRKTVLGLAHRFHSALALQRAYSPLSIRRTGLFKRRYFQS